VRTAAFVLSCIVAACTPPIPPRYVVEDDIESYRFRRYQQVLDVELPVEGNPAVGHTATYVRAGQSILITPVFVTVYARAEGLSDAVRAQLRAMDGYAFEIAQARGHRLFHMRGEDGEHWLLWLSGRHLIKLGAPEGLSDVPEEIVRVYLDRFPSGLDAQGRQKMRSD
jgi:hypothetical protein